MPTQDHVHLPSILQNPCGGYLPLSPTAPPQWRDAHNKRQREGPCTQPTTPHRQTRLDSPPPPHTHTGYSTEGYRSYRRWVSRSWRRRGTGPSEANCEVGHLTVGKWKIWKLWKNENSISLEQWLMISVKKMKMDICQENAMEISNEGTGHDFLNKLNVKKI